MNRAFSVFLTVVSPQELANWRTWRSRTETNIGTRKQAPSARSKMEQEAQLSTLNEIGMSISKMAHLTLSAFQMHSQRIRRQLKKLDSSNASRDQAEKDRWRRKGELYFRAFGWLSFFKRNEDCYTSEGTVRGSWDLRNKHRKIFNSKEWKWKDPLQRVKNSVEHKQQDCSFEYTLKTGIGTVHFHWWILFLFKKSWY